ncbi:MAG: YqiA/YcfP family alpha/beta fold hydrolase [Cyanobacteria bacterium P01_H01_bin.15]
MHVIYLHGFASSPRSQKAVYLVKRLRSLGLTVEIPDLNQGDFANLTLTRQLVQVGALIEAVSEPLLLVGSSFGGLTAAWLAERYPQVSRLVLLAPAFEFAAQWLPKLGPEMLAEWERTGRSKFFHYGDNKFRYLNYNCIRDLQRYDDSQLQRELPTLILHGQQDETIAVESSRRYVETHPWVKLIELPSDHTLLDSMSLVWANMKPFLPSSGR